MVKQDLEMRSAALQAWNQSGGLHQEALKLFKQHPRAHTISRCGRFVRRWGQGFAQRQSFSNKKPTGRRRKLDNETLDRAVGIFVAGNQQQDQPQPFSGINEALELSTDLNEIVTAHDMHPRTLLRNMQKALPSLKKCKEDLRPVLTERLKQQRLDACKQLLGYSDQYFRRIFFLDAKTMHIVPEAREVWVDTSQPMPIRTDSRKPRSGKDRRTLHFYAMVNWCVGPVALIYVTGTSGLKPAKTYTVCHSGSK